MHKYFSFFKKKAVYIPLGAVILTVGAMSIYGATHKPVYETSKAERRAFTTEVSVTGKVVAANDVELGFETGGKVSSIPAKVGSKVYRGQALAYVGSAALNASLSDAQARLDSANAELAQVKRGARPEEIRDLEKDRDQAKRDLENAISDSYVSADDLVRDKIDSMFDDANTDYPEFKYSFGNTSFRGGLEKKRVEVGDMLEKWKSFVDKLEKDGYDKKYLEEANKNLKELRDYTNDLAVAIAQMERDGGVPESAIAEYKANISSARSTISADLSGLINAEQAYVDAIKDVDFIKLGATKEDVRQQEAAVKSAEANVQQARAALSETVITAPFAGVITKIDLRAGELVSPGTPVISMISDANFEIESYIPEADIAKVEVGVSGTTTLDAYGDSVPFPVVVTAIDLSETDVEGVSTYKTTLQFNTADERIRSGMTANIDLVTETRQGVLSVPQSAVVAKDGKKTVLVMDESGATESKEVKTGKMDDDGNIEITEGLEEGATVVTNPPKKK